MPRVTDALMYRKGQDAINRQREKMVKNQEQSVTGLRVNKPSDDPVAAMRAIGLQSQMARDTQVHTNLDMASGILAMADGAMSELTDLLSRAKELAIQLSSSTNAGVDGRLSASNEIDQLLLRAVQLGNSRFGDRYVFAGYQTDRPPFDIDGNYYGDGETFELELDRGQKAGITIPGQFAFLGIQEVPQDALKDRSDPALVNEPTIKTQFRAPASREGVNDPGAVARSSSDDTAKSVLEREAEKGKIAKPNEGVNIFRALKSFSDALKNGEREYIHQALDDLDNAFTQVIQTRTLVGARQNIVKSGQDSLELAEVNNAELLSKVRDADSAEAFSELARNEHVLNASLQTSKKLLTPSLIDFLK